MEKRRKRAVDDKEERAEIHQMRPSRNIGEDARVDGAGVIRDREDVRKGGFNTTGMRHVICTQPA